MYCNNEIGKLYIAIGYRIRTFDLLTFDEFADQKYYLNESENEYVK